MYRGDIVWNRRTESKFYEVQNKRADRVKPNKRSGRVEYVNKDEWIVVENAVPEIIDRVTWDRAQAAAASRAECNHGGGRQQNRWLLSGVTRCAHCKQLFWGVPKKKGHKPGRAEVITNYYICGGR